MDANEILKTKKTYAVIGVSQDESKYGYEVFHILADNHYKVYPVNPKYTEIDGIHCFPSVSALPEEPEVIIIVLAPHNTLKTIENLVPFKKTVFWLPPECWSDEALNKLNQSGLTYIYDICPVGKLKGF